MNQNNYVPNRNLAHAAVLISGMGGILCLLGWILAGSAGVMWAMGLGIVVLTMTRRMTPRIVLRMYGAHPLHETQAPAVFAGVRELSRRAGLEQSPELMLIPSNTPNAFAVGTPGSAALAVSAGLVRSLPEREIIAVLGHEIAHIKNNDMRLMGLSDAISRITSMLSLFGQMLLLLNLPLMLTGHVTVPWPAIFILIGAPYASLLLQRALSRSREFDADAEGARLSGDPVGLANALARIELHQTGLLRRLLFPHTASPHPSPLRSHPETGQRVQRLRQLATLPAAHPPLHTLLRRVPPAALKRPPHRPRWTLRRIWY